MLPNGKVLDCDKINSLFPLDVAHSILAIPLFNEVEEYKLIWHDDLHGNYSVKSVYNLLLRPTVHASRTDMGDWKWLWKAQAPPKAKHLIWRICKECLPTRTRLKERFVNCPLIRPICEHEDESDWHIMFGRRAWSTIGVEAINSQVMQQATTTAEGIRNLCSNTDNISAERRLC
jgi:hypothetical protein